jgi:hypothetical protein
MAENNNQNQGGQENTQNSRAENSIGNQQGTSQTGAQNNRGDNVDQENDRYSQDLQQSGDRNSSNRKGDS